MAYIHLPTVTSKIPTESATGPTVTSKIPTDSSPGLPSNDDANQGLLSPQILTDGSSPGLPSPQKIQLMVQQGANVNSMISAGDLTGSVKMA